MTFIRNGLAIGNGSLVPMQSHCIGTKAWYILYYTVPIITCRDVLLTCRDRGAGPRALLYAHAVVY